MRRILLLLAAAGLVAVLVIGLSQAGGDGGAGGEPEPLTRAEVLEPLAGAPPELAQLHRRAGELVPGGARRFDAELRRLRGRPVVVNLWASWCGPCKLELPLLQRQAAQRGKEVGFLGVDTEDNRADARRTQRRYPVPYPSVEDPGGRVARRLGLVGLPGTAFYDARGELQYLKQGGYTDEAALARDIERHLG